MFKFNHSTRETQFVDYSTDKNTTSLSQVAIYNEDDLSHLLFLESTDHGAHIIVNKVDRSEPETPVETPLDTHGHNSDDESAILSDMDDESDLQIPSSPSRRRGGTMPISDDDFEFPVFLGRQQDVEVIPDFVGPALRRVDPVTTLEHERAVEKADTQMAVVDPEHHVTSVEGSMISWWPAAVDDIEYDWVEKSSQATIPLEKHVSELEGPMMAWWPASTEMLQHEWNERFYE